MTLGETVAGNLKRIRLERGLSQEELADLANVNRNYIGMIERRENSPTVDMIEQIAEALGVDPIRLFQKKS